MNAAYSSRLGLPRRGFTLVEVLVTMAFMAIVLPTVMSGFSLATTASGYAKNKWQATALAEAKLNEVLLQWMAEDDNSGIDSGYFPDYPQYRYVVETLSRDDLTAATAINLGVGVEGITEVAVHVMWNLRGQEYEVIVSGFVYPPDIQQQIQQQIQGGGQP